MIVFVKAATSSLLKPQLGIDNPSQPWIVALAAQQTDFDNNHWGGFDTIVRADGRKIQPGATDVHGITSEISATRGVNEIIALGFLLNMVSTALYVVGHGIDFDQQVIEGVLTRKGKDVRMWTRPGLQFIDTMKVATPFCRLAPREPRDDGQYRWPTLDEAAYGLLGLAPIAGPRDIVRDLMRTRGVFFELKKRGAFELVS